VSVEFSDADFQAKPNAIDNLSKNSNKGDAAGNIEYVSHGFAKGVADQVGRNTEAGASIGAGEFLPYAALRTILPRGVVDSIKGSDVGKVIPTLFGHTGKDDSDQYRGANEPYSPEGINERFVGDEKKAPNAYARTLGAGTAALGQLVANPIGGPVKVGKAALAAMGAGMGGELGAEAGKSAGNAVGGETGARVGEVAGSLIGGGAGAMANQVRGQILGGMTKPIERGVAAFKDTRQMQKQPGETRTFGQIFSSNLDNLRADAKGVIEQHVNERVAEALKKDPNAASKVQQFEQAATRQNIDPSSFELAQRTDNADVKLMASTQQPRNFEEAVIIQQRNLDQKDSIVKAYKNSVGDTTKAKDVVNSMEDFRKTENLRIGAIDTLIQREKNAVPRMAIGEREAIGDQVIAERQSIKGDLDSQREQKYSAIPEASGDKQYSFNEMPKTKELVSSYAGVADKSQVPESIKKVQALLGGSTKPTKSLQDAILTGDKKAVDAAMAAEKDSSRVPKTASSFMEADQQLTQDMQSSRSSGNWSAANNLSSVQQELRANFLAQADEKTKSAWNNAQKWYASEYAPKFRQGINESFDMASARGQAGASRTTSTNAVSQYLDSPQLTTSMKDFDVLFSKSPTAKLALSKEIQDRFHREVFSGDKFSETKASSFQEKYAPAIEKIDGLKDRLDSQVAKVIQLNSEKSLQQARYKELVGSPLTKTIGVEKSNAMVEQALKDPRRMNQLIASLEKHGGVPALMKDVESRMNFFKDGEFSPEKLGEVLTRGDAGLNVLFTKALGKDGAAKHMQNLHDIEFLGSRQKIADARNMGAAERISADPLKSASGSSGASWIAYVKNAAEGRTSGAYQGVFAGSRFLNQRVKNALNEAEAKAFTDPKTAAAILELYKTPPNQSISSKTANQLFGKAATGSSQIVDHLMAKGYILSTTVKGAQLGLTSQEDRRERPVN